MRPILIAMSHGNLARETVNSAKMIVGDMENVFVVSMGEDDGLSGTTEQLNTILHPFDTETQIVILADLKGGTPCNAAILQLSAYQNLTIVTGLNLAMLIEAVLSPLTTSDKLADHLEAAGRAAVEKIVPTVLEEDDEIDYEE